MLSVSLFCSPALDGNIAESMLNPTDKFILIKHNEIESEPRKSQLTDLMSVVGRAQL